MTIIDDAPTEPNGPLLIETLEHIRLFPAAWDQGEWRCGTRACFAGRAALLNGAKWALNEGHSLAHMPDYGVRLDGDGNVDTRQGDARLIYANDVTWVDGDGQLMFQRVHAYAKLALKISATDAGALFRGANDFNDLEAIVYRLTGAPVDVEVGP